MTQGRAKGVFALSPWPVYVSQPRASVTEADTRPPADVYKRQVLYCLGCLIMGCKPTQARCPAHPSMVLQNQLLQLQKELRSIETKKNVQKLISH